MVNFFFKCNVFKFQRGSICEQGRNEQIAKGLLALRNIRGTSILK